jgi:hypothetical protein
MLGGVLQGMGFILFSTFGVHLGLYTAQLLRRLLLFVLIQKVTKTERSEIMNTLKNKQQVNNIKSEKSFCPPCPLF